MPSSQLQRIAQVVFLRVCDVGLQSEPATRAAALGVEHGSERRRFEGRRHRSDGLGAISGVHRGNHHHKAESSGSARDSRQVLRVAGAIDPGKRDFEEDRGQIGGFESLARGSDGNRALGCGVRSENAERN